MQKAPCNACTAFVAHANKRDRRRTAMTTAATIDFRYQMLEDGSETRTAYEVSAMTAEIF